MRPDSKDQRALGWGALFAIAAMLAWVTACSDDAITPPPVVPTDTADLDELAADSIPVLSNPIAQHVAVPSIARHASVVALFQSDTGGDVVYVSLRPGSIPNGERAIIQRRGSASTLIAPIDNGGLDPVPIAATAGDSIDVEVALTGGGVLRFSLRAPPTRRPRVVRTAPPPKKKDVALNAGLVIVFSEPVDELTLTSATVQLLRNGNPVAGTVGLLEGTTAAAVFRPSAPLSPGTDYRLRITSGVRDLAGDSLSRNSLIAFTTGSVEVGPVASVHVAPDSADVLVGSQAQLAAVARDADGTPIADRPVTWMSHDPSIASVSAAGLVTALAEGSAFITAEVDGQFGALNLTVSASLPPVASVTLTPASARIGVGGTLTVEADTRDSIGGIVRTPRLLSWSSSNTSIATVSVSTSRTAIVRGVDEGVAMIVVTIDGTADTSVVSIGPPLPVVGLVLSPNPATTVLAGTVQLSAAVRDENGTLTPVAGSAVTWTSSDTFVASVDGTGLVTGRHGGSATITGTWNGHQATTAVSVVSLSFENIVADGSHTCGITPQGAAYCWAYGWDGQLGTGTVGYLAIPTAVAGGLSFSTVDVYWNYSCGLTTDGAVHCWGLNETGSERCPNGACSSVPVAAAGGLMFDTLTTGGRQTCALTAQGNAYCWEGLNWRNSPSRLSDNLTFAAISSGGGHTCALTPDGIAYCWGLNYVGQLGATSSDDCFGTPCSHTPIAVSGGLRFTALSAGETHTCGLTTGGAVYCWGTSSYYGGTGNITPARVETDITFLKISGKAGQTCGLTSTGAVLCWGRWGPGDLPTTMVESSTFVTLSVGEGYSCAVTATRAGYCWGRNDMGQLGIGGFDDYVAQPIKVGGQP